MIFLKNILIRLVRPLIHAKITRLLDNRCLRKHAQDFTNYNVRIYTCVHSVFTQTIDVLGTVIYHIQSFIHSSAANIYSTTCHLQSMVEMELWPILTNKCLIKIMCFCLSFCYIYCKVRTE